MVVAMVTLAASTGMRGCRGGVAEITEHSNNSQLRVGTSKNTAPQLSQTTSAGRLSSCLAIRAQ